MIRQPFRTLSLLLLMFVSSYVHGIESSSDSDSLKVDGKQKNLSIIPLPVVAYNPSNGLMLGLAPGANWFMGDRANTSISSGLGTAIYTTNKQLILTAKTNVFLSGDKWNLLGDIRYFITSQPTYGLGTGPNSNKIASTGIELEDGTYSEPIKSSQMMEFRFFRFHETVLKRHHMTRFFYGLGYHLDIHSAITDNLLDETADPPVYTSHYLYQRAIGMPLDNYTTSGVSVNFLYDSRDNSINPYSGRYAFVNLRVNPEFLGSDKSSSILWLEYRDYVHFDSKRPRHLLGFWTYGWFVTSGDVPYLDLPSVGWDQFGRSGRAYTQGRFRGEDLWYGETEYRFPLQKQKETLGAVVFLNLTAASNRLNDIQLFDYLNYAFGAGLRIMINKKSRTNINLDYAIGQYGQHGFYLGLNEVF
ncbi:BamA/TamA family outer membrane protein [Carboxylicivirga sediminis]|uniref:BamA/TamA family outer membrane protein n=1 Tax=Carboxylicivirga sediminis TaxID=2006564 RepID=A0A941F4Q1_9BACT|nr:BamA/TamA family outer membrane protein [Carboxylicivirga sediminis]MBR8536407.1 BamA/TamA family outer membrane protein [Carboxylicivirga sediminis]